MSVVRSRVLPALPILILSAALGLSDAPARDTDKSWEFGAFAMMSRYAGGTRFDNGTGFGVRGGYHFTAPNELELSFDSASADHSKIQGLSFDITKINLDFVRMFLIKGHEKMIPFATFGFGNMSVDDGSTSIDSTAYRVGGGFKYFFKPRGGLRFDVKAYRWHGGDFLPQDSFFSMDVQIGATFLVGGAK